MKVTFASPTSVTGARSAPKKISIFGKEKREKRKEKERREKKERKGKEKEREERKREREGTKNKETGFLQRFT